MKLKLLLLAMVIFMALYSCSRESKINQRFTSISPRDSGIDFENTLIESDSVNAYRFLYLYNGAGVGIGDFNNDGLSDVFLAGNMTSSKLYLNEGNFKFRDITKAAGLETETWVHGVSVVDVNNDGWLDIYLSIGGVKQGLNSRNLLFINNQDETFIESAEAFGLDDNSLTTHSAFFDYDLDGDLDVYMINYENNPAKDPNKVAPKKRGVSFPSSDKLYRNDQEKGFVDVTSMAGINQEGYGLGIAIGDFNDDGWPDVYVSNDFLYDDFLYINNQQGGFEDQAKKYLRHTSNFGMGIDIADLNNDGLMDIMQVDMLPENNRRQKKLLSGMNYDRFMLALNADYTPQYMRNSLQLNNGIGLPFSEVGELAGVAKTDWSWAPLIADFDNDGNNDIFITNGYAKDVTDVDFRNYVANATRESGDLFDSTVVIKALRNLEGEPIPNIMFKNNGGLVFSNSTEKWGLATPSYSTGAAYGDLDNDGDLDIVVNNINDKAFLYRNNTIDLDTTNYLQIKIEKSLGVEAELYHKGTIFKRHLNPYRGFQSSVDPTLHFGLGKITQVDSLILTWPNGDIHVEKGILSNQKLVFSQPQSSSEFYSKNLLNISHVSFEEITAEVGIDLVHVESTFVDFYREPLLPHKLSEEGPFLDAADVNNDGLIDMYIGGSAGQSGTLLIQKRNGEFIQKSINENNASEDSDVLFLDFDNDGDDDLYVASGGNEFDSGSELYQDRIYKNDGQGNFSLADKALPMHFFSTSKVIPSDFDGDGDLDLFVGGALDPGNYPLPGTSQILLNQGGEFKDITADVSEEISKVGMVRDALWADLNGDNIDELVITGEFMTLKVFEWQSKKLVDRTDEFGLGSFSGWWNSIKAEDIDNDGDLDLIAANQGLNTRYKTKLNEPVSVYAKDFDNNGRLDALLTSYYEGVEQLVYDKTTLSNQINAIKKKYKLNLDYASRNFREIFNPKELEESFKLSANHMETSLFINNGEGNFSYQALPIESQMSVVNTILVDDFNGDGLLDILFGGNSFAPEVFTGRSDAQATLMLAGKGNGQFVPVKHKALGLMNSGVVTDFEQISINNQPILVIARNSEPLRLFRKQELTPSLKKSMNAQIR